MEPETYAQDLYATSHTKVVFRMDLQTLFEFPKQYSPHVEIVRQHTHVLGLVV
jgi:hypothetical protein